MSKYKLSSPVAADRAMSKPATMFTPISARYHAGTISLHGMNDASTIRLVAMNGRVVGSWRHHDGHCLLPTC
ncbi:MAG: hypothetical protein JW913_03705 [Chitinispirillaceae bacterium]|nr:hypothetical protein [Chitinispirillaceae bacterium]